jgi:hypothetical protein
VAKCSRLPPIGGAGQWLLANRWLQLGSAALSQRPGPSLAARRVSDHKRLIQDDTLSASGWVEPLHGGVVRRVTGMGMNSSPVSRFQQQRQIPTRSSCGARCVLPELVGALGNPQVLPRAARCAKTVYCNSFARATVSIVRFNEKGRLSSIESALLCD